MVNKKKDYLILIADEFPKF